MSSEQPNIPCPAAGGMPDLQKSRDTRNIAIDKVGVKDIR